jgi:hypothetical protein
MMLLDDGPSGPEQYEGHTFRRSKTMWQRTQQRNGYRWILLLIFAVMAVGPVGAAEPGAAVSGTFVGPVPGTQALIAVHAGPVHPCTGHEVAVYVCDGRPQGLILWFAGTVVDNRFSGRSASDEATITLELSQQAATGTITLENGKQLPFAAPPATGASGLYRVTLFPDQSFRGDQFRGDGRISGRFASLGGSLRLEGEVCQGDGQRIRFTGPPASLAAPGDYRVIIGPMATGAGGAASGSGIYGSNYAPFAQIKERTSPGQFINALVNVGDVN